MNIYSEKIIDYLLGDLDKQEIEKINHLISTDKEFAEKVEKAKTLIQSMAKEKTIPMNPDLPYRITKRLRETENKGKKRNRSFKTIAAELKSVFEVKGVQVVLATLIVGLLVMPTSKIISNLSHIITPSPNVIMKDGPKLTNSPRHPVPTILLETKELNLKKVKNILDKFGIRTIAIDENKFFIAVEAVLPPDTDIVEIFKATGDLIRFNKNYLNEDGHSVIVIRQSL